MPWSDRTAIPKDAELDRRLCPEHHATLVDRASPTVYHNDCGHAYRDADRLDRRET